MSTPKRSIATFDHVSVAFFSPFGKEKMKNKNSHCFLETVQFEPCTDVSLGYWSLHGCFDEYNKQATNFMDGTKISLLTRKLSTCCSKHFLGISTGTH